MAFLSFVAFIVLGVGIPWLIYDFIESICPAGGFHNWHYTGHYLDLAKYHCSKCSGTKQVLVTQNYINYEEYRKRKGE